MPGEASEGRITGAFPVADDDNSGIIDAPGSEPFNPEQLSDALQAAIAEVDCARRDTAAAFAARLRREPGAREREKDAIRRAVQAQSQLKGLALRAAAMLRGTK